MRGPRAVFSAAEQLACAVCERLFKGGGQRGARERERHFPPLGHFHSLRSPSFSSLYLCAGTTTIDAYDRAAAEAMNVGKAERRPAGEAGEGHTSRASRMGEAAAEAKTGGSRPPPSYGYDGPGAQSQYGGYGSERGSHPDARRSRSRSGERKPEARGSREEGHAYAEKVPQPTPAVAEVAAEEEEEADEMAAMLGFSDFGGSKKR